MCVSREDHMTPIRSSAQMVSVFLCYPHMNECMHLQSLTNCISGFLLQVLHLIYFYTVIHMFYITKQVHI